MFLEAETKNISLVTIFIIAIFLSACVPVNASVAPDPAKIDCRKAFAANDRYVVDMIAPNGILAPQYGTVTEGNVATFSVPVGYYVGVTTGLNVSFEFSSGEPVSPTPCSDTVWYKSSVGTTLFLRPASP